METKQADNFSGSYIEATGRRKTTVARVRLYEQAKGDDAFIVNGVPIDEYFSTGTERSSAREALNKLKTGDYAISAIIRGGGKAAHAEALRHGIARALASTDEENKRKLKKAGLLRHDDRQKERKKFGKKKARKSPQWSKR